MDAEPKTLQQATVTFADQNNCREYMVPRRWNAGIVTCPTCGSDKVKFQPQHNRWQCSNRHPRRQFTLKTGTVMEDSPLGLDKWMLAMWLIASNRNGISSWELHRALGITQKSAWFLLHRIRLAMQDELTGGSLAGEVEVDETFIGGKARNMHKDRKARVQKHGRNTGGKAVVMGMLERGKKVRATVIPDRTKAIMQPIVKANVESGSQIFSDEHGHNWKMDEYEHSVVNHLTSYVDGNVHTNGIENFWSLLKRTINGTYVSVEDFHLFRYVDEQAFRFNNRLPLSDGDRFSYLVRKIVGKRLTYAELTGQTEEGPKAEEEIPF
ncbi:MAG TPA: IS1595 family transposase [Bryobacteraceae bacterium]|nr:IS1595 family transposase [Bryobacteraceae bacterium]